MPLPIIPGVIRCAFNWLDGASGLKATNVCHFAEVDNDPDALNTSLQANFTNNMWALQSNAVAMQSITYTPLFSALAGSTEHPITSIHAAGTGSPDYSPQSCTIIKLGTGSRGRSARGRLYLPFIGETQQTKGTIQVVDANLVTGAWVAFVAAMALAAKPMQVASYKHATALPVSSVVCETRTGTQRRRQSQQR